LFLKRGSFVQFGYEDLRFETERWARRFLAAGLEEQSIVAIVLDHRIDLYGAYLGAMRAGLIPTFLPYRTPKQDEAAYWRAQQRVIDRVRPACVVTYGAMRDRLATAVHGFACTTIDVDAPWHEILAALPPLDEVEAPDRIALLQHSSGTTGAKKGVALGFDTIAQQAEALGRALPVSQDDRTISWLPLYHDMGLLTAFLLPIIWGSSVVSFDAFEWLARPSLFFELIERFRGTHAWLPNFALNHLVRTCEGTAPYDLSSLRAIVSSSEPCKPATFDRFTDAFCGWKLAPGVLRSSYGMAEAVFACTLSAPGRAPSVREDADLAYLSCGRVLRGIDVRVGSSEQSAVGEIFVRGTYVVDGYFRNPEATAASFSDGWFATGDIGFMADDELYVCGRTKETIVVHGRNYFAQDIEEIVNAVAGVKPGRSIAIGRFDAETASEEVAILAERESPSDDATLELESAIRRAVFGAIGLRVRAVRILTLGSLVKTTSGKLSREENARFLDDGPVVANA
jgi:acyl-CoA synthetase (AMP-forming)/AMP-acid ligase II